MQPASKTHREQACGANRPFAKKAKSLTLNGETRGWNVLGYCDGSEQDLQYLHAAIAILGWADRYRTTSNGPADCSAMNGNVFKHGSPMAYR